MKRLCTLVALLSLCLAAGQVWAEPQTQPANTSHVVYRVAATHPTTKEPLVCLVDVDDAIEAKDWALKAATYALKWYPKLEETLASDGYTPTREFTLRVKHTDGVAATSGKTITVNADYIKDHAADQGMVAHELVHVIQHYRRGEFWITEGIADYVRYYVVEPGTPRARFDSVKQTYKNGYQPAAAFLNWLETAKGPGIVAKLNAALRDGKYSADGFKTITGGTPDELWDQFKATLSAKKKAA